MLTEQTISAHLCGGNVNMNQQIQSEEESNMAMGVETNAALRDQLAQWSFSTEEIATLFWLRHWYQTGSSDHVKFCATGSFSGGQSRLVG